LLHGDSDEVVSIEASRKYIKDSYKENAKLTVIARADHMFSNQFWAEKVIDNSVDFFMQQLLG